eukprot:14042298-Ditylum_brightwellii.AAC.1
MLSLKAAKLHGYLETANQRQRLLTIKRGVTLLQAGVQGLGGMARAQGQNKGHLTYYLLDEACFGPS